MAIQTATTTVMLLREPGARSRSSTNTASLREVHRKRHGRPALKQPPFMEVTNILKTKMYNLTDEEQVPIIKDWLGREGLQLIKTFMNPKKETCQRARDLFSMRNLNIAIED